MKQIVFLLLVAAMSLAGAASADAQGMHNGKGKNHDMPMFSDIDANGDGAVVAEEFYEFRGQHMAEQAAAGGKMKNAANAPAFETIDANGDGEISEEEFDAHKAEMMEKRQQRMQSSQE